MTDYEKGYEQGQRDALAGAVQRVEALWVEAGVQPSQYAASLIVAAIKGDEGG
jgi:hypothetical protein